MTASTETLLRAIEGDISYATHLPVLAAIGETTTIRRVVEYGPGPSSTPFFLNRAFFPTIERLTTYEDSPGWHHRMQAAIHDERWCPHLLRPGMFSAIDRSVVEAADLVLIDGSSVDGRVALLCVIRDALPPTALVVLHDYDGPEAYRWAASQWPHLCVAKRMRPATAVLSASSVGPALGAAIERWESEVVQSLPLPQK